MNEKERMQVRELWRMNSHEIQPSNGYCCSKSRYIKYKTETGMSIYGPDYQRTTWDSFLARAAPSPRRLGYRSLMLFYGLRQIDG